MTDQQVKCMESCREVLATLTEPERKEVLEEMLGRMAASKRPSPALEIETTSPVGVEEKQEEEGVGNGV